MVKFEVFKRFLRGVLLILSVAALDAEESPWPEEWRWGMAAWEDHGVSANYQYLLRSIPLRLLRYVSPVGEHQFSQREALAYLEKRRRSTQEELAAQVSKHRTQLDEMFFDVTKGASDRAVLNKKWLESKKKWEESRLYPPSIGHPPLGIPLKILGKDEQEDLLPPLVDLPERYEPELEYLAAGSIEEVGNVLFFTFRLYSFVENRDLFLLRNACLPEETESFFGQAGSFLAEHLLGRKWGTITVESEVPATLYLNGNLVGEQAAHIPFLAPGYYTLEAVAPGYLPSLKGIVLMSQEKKEVFLEMEEGEWLDLSVITTPPGADVFVGSRWLGVTPWVGQVPPEYNRIILRKEGYRETLHYLTPRRGAEWEITLEEEGIDREKEIEARRDWFYFSLGAFLVSIPVTMTLYSIYDISSGALSTELDTYGTSDETERLAQTETIGNYGFWGSLFINVGLFANLVVGAVDYVKTAGADFKK